MSLHDILIRGEGVVDVGYGLLTENTELNCKACKLVCLLFIRLASSLTVRPAVIDNVGLNHSRPVISPSFTHGDTTLKLVFPIGYALYVCIVNTYDVAGIYLRLLVKRRACTAYMQDLRNGVFG